MELGNPRPLHVLQGWSVFWEAMAFSVCVCPDLLVGLLVGDPGTLVCWVHMLRPARDPEKSQSAQGGACGEREGEPVV